MRLKAVLLDMGGVLIDFEGGRGLPVGRADWRGREALLHHLEERGSRIGFEELDSLFFAPWFREYRRREERGLDAEWDSHCRRLRKRTGIRTHTVTLLELWFRPFGEQLEALPGVVDALERIKRRGLRMSLISNVPLPGHLYRKVLERCGLGGYFSSFHFSYDAGSRKPSPVMLREALAVLGVSPPSALMVGDRRGVDIAAGRLAGTRTAWVRSGDRAGPAADLEVASLADLPDVL